MQIDEVELRVIRVPFRSAFKTSFGSQTEKVTVIITVRSEGVEGYGEGVMESLPEYREETHHRRACTCCARRWCRLCWPRLRRPGDAGRFVGTLARQPDGKTVARVGGVGLLRPPAGRAAARPARRHGSEIPVGASLGMNPLAETLESVGRHVAEGYKRIKLKVEPGWDHELLGPVRAAVPRHRADGRRQLGLHARRHRHAAALRRVRPELHRAAAALGRPRRPRRARARSCSTPLCLDETLTSPARVRAALDLGACTVVNLKVGRVGGLAATQRIHDLCVERGVPMWCGGMLETGIGRAHNIHVATLPGFIYPGDTASASRTYARDIVEQPLEAIDGIMPVPLDGPGIGVTLDRPFLDEVTESVEVLRDGRPDRVSRATHGRGAGPAAGARVRVWGGATRWSPSTCWSPRSARVAWPSGRSTATGWSALCTASPRISRTCCIRIIWPSIPTTDAAGSVWR